MTTEVTLDYRPRGAARELFARRDRQIVLDGPAGTGKTYAALNKVHAALLKYPGARALMVRKTLSSLKETALVTYQEKVLHPAEGVRYYGGSAVKPPQFTYPNGSQLLVGGMDRPDKVMSAEYDLIYVNEATDITEDAWEKLTTRLRYAKMPYQQIIGDCNPQSPKHWLNVRMMQGQTARLISRHEDNPTVTPEYLATLQSLTGVRYLRLYKGQWAAADGMVYQDEWDAAVHIIPAFPIPQEWPRYLAIDFGFNNPFVCLWAAEDPDGRLIIYRQIYMSHRLVEDHARQIKHLSQWGLRGGDPYPRAIICDHDAEGRATLEAHLGLVTIPAIKTVAEGIEEVKSRLRVQGDGKPRLMVIDSSLVEIDQTRARDKLPLQLADEVESYIWDLRNGAKAGDVPVKEHDHAMDAERYLVMHRARVDLPVGTGPILY